jgi:hypothetical protein
MYQTQTTKLIRFFYGPSRFVEHFVEHSTRLAQSHLLYAAVMHAEGKRSAYGPGAAPYRLSNGWAILEGLHRNVAAERCCCCCRHSPWWCPIAHERAEIARLAHLASALPTHSYWP